MAADGVQTLFIQSAFADDAADVPERDRLVALIARAHARHLRVVGWYLPTLTDVDADLRRLVAVARLPVDGVAVDIESRTVSDAADRSRRLVALSGALRRSLPGRVLGAIVLPPVVTEVINPSYWPGFPWSSIAGLYDVWLPMSYWTNRTDASGYRDAYRYTVDDIVRLRRDLGSAGAPVHTIGGIADKTTVADLEGLLRAALDTRVLGASLYDWRTTSASAWPRLAALRR
jgi:hypothetical protein